MKKTPLLHITNITHEFLLENDPSEIHKNSLLNINLNRVILNLLNSLGEFFNKEIKALGARKASLKKFLYRDENKSIFSNGIWMTILTHNFFDAISSPEDPISSFHKKTIEKKNLKKLPKSKILRRKLTSLNNKLQQAMALSYISLMRKVRKEIKMVIEKVYFDVVAQAVFYSLFYAFPKSRINFNYDFRYFLFALMSKFFVGLVVSPVSRFSQHWTFVDDWYLDLGAGNVLAKKMYHKRGSSGPRSPLKLARQAELADSESKASSKKNKPKSKIEMFRSVSDESQEETEKTKMKKIAKGDMHLITWKKVHQKKQAFSEKIQQKMRNPFVGVKGKELRSKFPPVFKTAIDYEKKRQAKSRKFKQRKQELRFSPLIQQYMCIKKIIYKNCAPSFKIKLTPYHSIMSEIESKNKVYNEKFNEAMKIAKYYENKLKRNTLNKTLNKEINKIKFQALDNSRRLHKRKVEETKYGAHEYANYILSILNSDYTI